MIWKGCSGLLIPTGSKAIRGCRELRLLVPLALSHRVLNQLIHGHNTTRSVHVLCPLRPDLCPSTDGPRANSSQIAGPRTPNRSFPFLFTPAPSPRAIFWEHEHLYIIFWKTRIWLHPPLLPTSNIRESRARILIKFDSYSFVPSPRSNRRDAVGWLSNRRDATRWSSNRRDATATDTDSMNLNSLSWRVTRFIFNLHGSRYVTAIW